MLAGLGAGWWCGAAPLHCALTAAQQMLRCRCAHQKLSAHTAQEEGGCFVPRRPVPLCDQGMAMLFVLDLVAREP